MAEMKRPAWIKINESELREIIAELAKKNSPSKIGLILRDQYGVPTTKVFGKKLNKYLQEMGIERNETIENAENKVSRLKEHLKSNITDKNAKHRLQKAQSRLNVAQKYFGVEKRKKKKK